SITPGLRTAISSRILSACPPQAPAMQTSDDFDGCWKEALDGYFPSFMVLLWPRIASQIDWSRKPEFLDQELQKLVGNSENGARRVDKLVKVWMNDGS